MVKRGPTAAISRRIQYPNVVEPDGSGWKILFVDTPRPWVVARLESRFVALTLADAENANWRIDRDARRNMRSVISAIEGENFGLKVKQPAGPLGSLLGLIRNLFGNREVGEH